MSEAILRVQRTTSDGAKHIAAVIILCRNSHFATKEIFPPARPFIFLILIICIAVTLCVANAKGKPKEGGEAQNRSKSRHFSPFLSFPLCTPLPYLSPSLPTFAFNGQA